MEGYKNFIWCRYSKHLNDCGNYNLICEDENGKKLFSIGGTGYSKEHHAIYTIVGHLNFSYYSEYTPHDRSGRTSHKYFRIWYRDNGEEVAQ